MADRRRSRTTPTGRTALGRALLAWLAVLAVVVQTAVPDAAMAARRAAERAATVAAHHVGHGRHGGDRRPDAPAPAGHAHDTLCAFCLALGTHGLAAVAVDAVPVPAAYAVPALPVEAGVRLRPFFLTGHSPRAPPAPRQV